MTRPRRPVRALLTAKQIAAMLNCAERTVYRLVKEGKLSKPRKLTGGASRWFPQDVKVYRYRLLRGDFET
jgi:excisionase family DNA binding protein